MATLYITQQGFRFPYQEWTDVTTIQNLQFLEAQLEHYLHSHESDGTTLWVTSEGFRTPDKKVRANLENNMKFVEAQLEHHLHEHEVLTRACGDMTYTGDLTKSIAFFSSGPAYGDGFLWDADNFTNKIYRIDPSDGTTVLISTVAPAGFLDYIAYFDGKAYVLDGETLYVVSTSTGSVLDTFVLSTTAGLTFVGGLFHDGTNLWTQDWNDNTIYLIDPSDGTANETFTFAPLDGLIVNGIMELDGNIWFTGALNNQVLIMDKTTRTTACTVSDATFDQIGTDAHGITTDGNTVWTGEQNNEELHVFDLATIAVMWTHVGFRFPYGWENEGHVKHNMRFLETQISKYLHEHEVGA